MKFKVLKRFYAKITFFFSKILILFECFDSNIYVNTLTRVFPDETDHLQCACPRPEHDDRKSGVRVESIILIKQTVRDIPMTTSKIRCDFRTIRRDVFYRAERRAKLRSPCTFPRGSRRSNGRTNDSAGARSEVRREKREKREKSYTD